MVEKRLSPLIPPLNYGISSSDQKSLYEFDEKKKREELIFDICWF